MPEPLTHRQQLGIDIRTRRAEHLGPDLVKLTGSAALRTFMPEHGALIPEFPRRTAQQARFDGRTNAASRAFRAQAEAFAVAVLKGVHLLFDDVRDFADRIAEVAEFLNSVAKGDGKVGRRIEV